MKTKWMLWMGIVAAGMASVAYGISYNPDIFTLAAKGGNSMGTTIAGNFVVWNDMMEMKWFGYDLAKRESFPILAGMPMNPLINESYMVWSDGALMNWNGFELATKRRFSLGITDADGMGMKMTGRFLIYRGMMDMTVRGVDLASGEKFIIANTDIQYMSIRAAGDYVIWGTQPWPGVLAGFQLSTREGFVLSNSEMIDGMSIVMNDRFAAWVEMPAEPTEAGLYCFDLANRERFLITREFINSMSLRIGGNYIIGQYTGSQAIYGFDAVARESFEMAAGNVDSMSLTVNDRYAIWRDMGSQNIIGFELAPRRLIFTGMENMYTPALAKSYFFWTLMPDPATTELRGFDLDTGQPFFVAAISGGAPNSPIAGGDYVVWTDMVQPALDTQLLGARIWKVPNDLCEDAAALTVGVPFLGDTSGALGTDSSSCGFEDWRDTWHEFRPAMGGEYTIDAHSEAFDTTLATTGACTGAETACNDDASIQTTDSRLVMTMVKGKRYLFRVAGIDGSGGPYALTISRGSCPVPLEGDLTDDCKVNMEDLAIVSAQWLDCGLAPAELCN